MKIKNIKKISTDFINGKDIKTEHTKVFERKEIKNKIIKKEK